MFPVSRNMTHNIRCALGVVNSGIRHYNESKNRVHGPCICDVMQDLLFAVPIHVRAWHSNPANTCHEHTSDSCIHALHI